jgi:hypothetical protein
MAHAGSSWFTVPPAVPRGSGPEPTVVWLAGEHDISTDGALCLQVWWIRAPTRLVVAKVRASPTCSSGRVGSHRRGSVWRWGTGGYVKRHSTGGETDQQPEGADEAGGVGLALEVGAPLPGPRSQ